MNTKIIFTRNSPLRTVLVDEATGRELYRIHTPIRFVGSVTRVFRCDPAAPPVPNLVSQQHGDASDPHEDESDGNEGDSGVASAVDEAPGDDSPFVENEVARLYWKWFASSRIVFDGKVRRRAEFMPMKGKLKRTYVFSHNNVSYRWILSAYKNPRWRLVIDDSDQTLVARFCLASPFKKGSKSYFEVTPAGMAILDHIVVTFIPVEFRRRQD